MNLTHASQVIIIFFVAFESIIFHFYNEKGNGIGDSRFFSFYTYMVSKGILVIMIS